MSSGRAAVFVALAVASVAAQERSQPAFRSDTSAVVVDVVVRDKKGNPVTDLKATDFQLLEDGEPQVVRDVTLIAPQHGGTRPGRSSDAGAAPSSGGTSTQATAARTQTFVAFIFDRLSPEARVMAHAAALAYLDTPTANDFAGVFLADLSLETIQTFTNDRAVLRKAFDRVVMRPTSGFDRLRIGDSSTGDRDPGTPMTAGADSSGSAAAMANAPAAGGRAWSGRRSRFQSRRATFASAVSSSFRKPSE